MNNSPTVSICCTTYNHENYIENTIEGFLAQKTTFRFEIIIHDDASTDSTSEIILNYAERYPKLIFPIIQVENQWSRGVRPSPTFVWPNAKGKYIALCEGDDYWNDPNKLQKQIDFLLSNEDCSMTFCGCEINNLKDNNKKEIRYPNLSKIDINEYFRKSYFMATCSLVFKKEILKNYECWMNDLFAGDFVLKSLALLNGKIGYVDRVMCVYNKGLPDSWTRRKFNNKILLKEFKDNLKVINHLDLSVGIQTEIRKNKIKELKQRFYFLKSLEIAGFKGLLFLASNYNKISKIYLGAYVKNYILKKIRFR